MATSTVKLRNKRHFTDPILLSTLPHYLPLLFVVNCDRTQRFYLAYSIVVALSASLSLIWHGQREPHNWLFWLDYGMAFLWTMLDLFAAVTVCPNETVAIVGLNVCVCVAHVASDHMAKTGVVTYEWGHCCWHVMSSVKSTVVAYVIGCRGLSFRA
jgi:hypothetical protein